ncbi:MAG: YgiQ family radical SAM protein [Planctomycetota bacterium]
MRCPLPSAPLPLPMTQAEVAARGWDAVDVVFVTGDAYVDHPSFAMALLGRVLEAEGFRVAILSQPNWHSCEPWRSFGCPRLCFAVSAGNMDSMLNHYTANRKVRNDDAYSPGAQIGRRPDRATLAYCQRAREAYRGVPVITGGVEASLRRLAHYDFWSDKVRRSILLDAKADLLVYGMGERPLMEIVKRLAAGQSVRDLRDIRGTAYRLGARETNDECKMMKEECTRPETSGRGIPHSSSILPHSDAVLLPSYEEVATDKAAFAAMTQTIFHETNPYNARRLVQYHGREAVVINPPAWPLAQEEIDRVYDLPFTRRPHPSYGRERIPAFEVVKDSIQIVRGCFGGCTFCSIAAHEGRIIQSRSERSILDEIGRMAEDPAFSGTISDLGGPTANMYQMNCSQPDMRDKCHRLSCLHPTICPLLATDHGPLLCLLGSARKQRGVKQTLVASGIRMDLARRSPEYIRQIARHHTGGLLKVAPEHSDPEVLRLMKKPPIEEFEAFACEFHRESAVAGKQQFLVPYFIAGHPGSDLSAMIELALYLKRHGLKPDKVQDFIPGPMDIAACMYHTGLDPMSGKPVYVPRGARERRLQRALLQYFKPEDYADVHEALTEAGRPDLIGDGPECLISSKPPKIIEKAKRAPRHPANQTPATGYRPHRKTTNR